MASEMRFWGNVGKAWAFAPNYPNVNSEALGVSVTGQNGQCYWVTWGYHVAPTILVRSAPGEVESMVIDPSMFGGPVTPEKWVGAMNQPGATLILTGLGQAPFEGEPGIVGTGYGPGPDPADGLDAEADLTMLVYSLKEWSNRSKE